MFKTFILYWNIEAWKYLGFYVFNTITGLYNINITHRWTQYGVSYDYECLLIKPHIF